MENTFENKNEPGVSLLESPLETIKEQFLKTSTQKVDVLKRAAEIFPRAIGREKLETNHRNALIRMSNIRANFEKYSNIFKNVEEGFDPEKNDEHIVTTLNNLHDLITRQISQLQGFIEMAQEIENPINNSEQVEPENEPTQVLENNTSTSPTKTSEVLIEKEDQEVDVYTKIRNRYMKIKGDVGNLVVFDATVKDTPVYETHKRQVIKIESLLRDKRSITGNFSYIQALLNIMEEDVKKMLSSIDRQSTSGESKPEKIKPKSEEEILKEMDSDIERFRLLLGADSEDNEQLATLIRIRSLVADQGEEDKTVHKTRLVPYLRVYRENLEKLEKDLQAQPSRKPKGEGLPYGIPITEAMKDNYQTSGERLHALNAELIALDKALAENMALPEEDWVLQKRKGIWLQMDLKDLESIQTKRTYLKNYKKLVESLPTETELPTNPTVEFEKASLERRLAWENETTKKRFGLIKGIIKRRKTVGTTAGTVGIMLATALGNGEIPSGGKNNFDISGYSPNKISVGQALADSSEEMPIIVTNSDVGFVSHEAPQLRNIDLVADSLPAVMTPPEPVVPPTASLETIPGVAFSEPITQSGINNNTIFGDKNIQFGHDLGVELKSPEKISSDNLATLEKMESNRFLVEVPHDVYWNIMEGQTKAGELPFLAKINLKHKQEVIDLVRDRIDDDHQLRINLGFGQSSADQTYIGTEIDTGLLNELAMKVATEHGYLLPENTSTAVPDAISQSEIASVAKSQSIDLANTGGEKVRLESSPIIVTDDVAEQFKNNFPGGLEAYTRAFDSWVRAIEGFTDSEGGWFSNLFGGVHKSAITTLGEKTIAEVKNLSKLSKQELRAEAQALGLPVDKLRTSLMEFNKWVESEQIKGINSTDKFSKLIIGAFVLEKLTPSPQGEKK